jgi:hypothetical protein
VTKDDVVTTFVRLAVDSDLDAIGLEELRQSAHKLSGIGLRVIDTALKAAKQQQNEQRAQSTHGRRQDPRPRIWSPAADAPFKPVMVTLNDAIGPVIAARPPARQNQVKQDLP